MIPVQGQASNSLGSFFCTELRLLECFLILLSLTAAVAVLLTVILIIIIGVLAVGGFFNYRRTGSLLPALPKLPRYVLKAFRTGMAVNLWTGNVYLFLSISEKSIFFAVCPFSWNMGSAVLQRLQWIFHSKQYHSWSLLSSFVTE